ncbi:NAD(P)H-binding protein [Actinacidiphila sp. ITFR-21]|uniref:NAD(P)H-binding protein n=1 Tax=Actinacidiphila sp. ITFR-21 TaxID=3075199 RepID=UPI00288BBB95|nr:NAD(P)H-binding protein [Streptomyces sp. ITFR-21]WNI16357.1 NAD(P)H-binding protein [Streptomyces sp. ITFR-21]
MILVTGATGVTGGEVARLLAAAGPVRVLVRDRARLTVTGPRVEVAEAAYADRDGLLRALKGIRAAFLVTTDPGSPDDDRFMAAAVRAGVRHVVKLSSYAAGEEDADDLITEWQRAAERTIRGSGVDWTFLRPRSFMSNTLAWAPSIRAEGVVRSLHAAAANACVDPRDIAEVAVRALTTPGHAGRVYALTGPEALTAADQTARLADVLGRPLAFEELTFAQAAAQWAARYPAPVVDALLRSARRQSLGHKATVTRTVTDLTGRPPRSFRDWAASHRAAFL